MSKVVGSESISAVCSMKRSRHSDATDVQDLATEQLEMPTDRCDRNEVWCLHSFVCRCFTTYPKGVIVHGWLAAAEWA